MPIAQALRNLPRPDFKGSLKSDLQRRISMSESAAPSRGPVKPTDFRRPNFPNIAPYFLVPGAPKFIDFLVSAFEGTERIRVPRPDGAIMHAEVAIGNSVIELGDANEQYPQRSMTTHLYVPDADATYARALRAGATGVYAPTDDHPSGDRWGEAKDPFGNTWYIATRRSQVSGAEGFLTVQPYLHLRDAHNMIPFAESALGANATGVHKSPDGMVMHATIEIAGATFEIDEARGEVQPEAAYLHVYVPDTDAVYAQAIRAGATGVTPPSNAPYGDRAAAIKDPFGNTWFLATYLSTGQR
jgi:PhnB protein